MWGSLRLAQLHNTYVHTVRTYVLYKDRLKGGTSKAAQPVTSIGYVCTYVCMHVHSMPCIEQLSVCV